MCRFLSRKLTMTTRAMWLWSAEEEIANDDGMGILNFTAAPHGGQSFRVDRLLVEVSPDSLAGEGELRVRSFLLIHVQPLDRLRVVARGETQLVSELL